MGPWKAAFWLAAVVCAALALAACGGDDDEGNGGGGGGGGGGAAQLELHTDGQLTIGAEFPVKGFVELPIDDPKGFEVDLADAICQGARCAQGAVEEHALLGAVLARSEGLRHGDQ